ncbi:hypothetical protein EYF80_003011 [Liparis tanakae]|uniref:Uncharacterized protein n=1 Tax=Liparis tanakae TaxID=230148 RepID=A0A4Z2JAY2_9TELE|nr:hypothetical protein EYF80_003011 [Liparis tanakae]
MSSEAQAEVKLTKTHRICGERIQIRAYLLHMSTCPLKSSIQSQLRPLWVETAVNDPTFCRGGRT